MQTPYFTEGQTEPIDPTKAVEDEKSAQKNGGEQQDEVQKDSAMQKRDGNSAGFVQNEQNGGLSGVRKILHPAEAIDSARHTAEVIMKDAMDALLRTKQRLMEMLPSLVPSHAADDATKVVENVEKDMLVKAEGGVLHAGTDKTTTSDDKGFYGSGSITSNATMGNLDQTKSNIDIQSVKKRTVVAKL